MGSNMAGWQSRLYPNACACGRGKKDGIVTEVAVYKWKYGRGSGALFMLLMHSGCM